MCGSCVHIYVLLTTLVFLLTSVLGLLADTYYVTPTPSTPCPGKGDVPCFTLSQYARNSSDFVFNSTLILLPGNHSLDLEFSVRDIMSLTMSIETTLNPTLIHCIQPARFYFANINFLRLRGLVIFGCINNNVSLVKKFTLENFSLQGQRGIGTGLELHNVSSANIVSSSFSLGTVNYCTICIFSSFITISSGVLSNNTIIHNARAMGGAVYVESSNMTISSSLFTRNNNSDADDGYGLALSAVMSKVIITNTTFSENSVYGHFGSIVFADSSNILLNSSSLDNNCGYSSLGTLYSKNSTLCINNSTLMGNTVIGDNEVGGAVFIFSSTLSISGSMLNNNRVLGNFGAGGALFARSSTVSVQGSTFSNNSVIGEAEEVGGAIFFEGIYSYYSISREKITLRVISLNNCTFTNNTATGKGGALYLSASNFTSSGFLEIQNNRASKSSTLYAEQSSVCFLGNVTLSNNYGSLYAFSCNVTFLGSNKFLNNSFLFQEGGALTSFQSTIVFSGTALFANNTAVNGGAISVTDSTLYIYNNVTFFNNTAKLSGGGVYAYHSEFYTEENVSMLVIGNKAEEKGGGFHAIGTTMSVKDGSKSYFVSNEARYGGGLYLETNSKLYIVKRLAEHSYENRDLFVRVEFSENSAKYGGALYIADNTNSGLCYGLPFGNGTSVTTDCVVQTLSLIYYRNPDFNTQNIYFQNNTARVAGDTIYGGVFDRCTVSPFAEFFNKYPTFTPNSLSATSYLLNITDLTAEDYNSPKLVSSDAVRVCFCRAEQPDCSYQPQPVQVHKGETFNVSLVAVDQVNNTHSNSTIHGFVELPTALGEGQSIQLTKKDGSCTNLSYSIFSLQNNMEQLHLYADGPCMSTGISRASFSISIVPCPVGFKDTNKHCECDPILTGYIHNCSIVGDSVLRKEDVWISYNNISGYLLYSHCPYDYCKRKPVSINLNTVNGFDEQCAFNRSGKLCGSCKDGLSLSLGSSECMKCSNVWLTLVALFVLAGIGLVAFLLVFNLTVAIGTINGIIFYANIIIANRAIFLPFNDKPNVLTVFIAWLNLDFGFTTCFYNGMDGYAKTWLQLAFPAYVIFLVLIIILVSQHSWRFAQFLSNRNPVATLATLILLSYTKLLRAIIFVLSFANLHYLTNSYGNGSHETVWLVDADISYFKGKHIPLFLTAVAILVIGLLFSFLLFFWQWLLKCPHRRPFRWIRNTKLNSFMDAYCAPYMTKHRYWTGLLLFIRLLLYLVISLNNVSDHDPAVNLFCIICVAGIVLLLMALLKEKVYKKWPIYALETSFIFNLIFVSAAIFYAKQSNKNSTPFVYTSISIALITFVAIVIYHTYEYVLGQHLKQALGKIKVIRRSSVNNERKKLIIPTNCDVESCNLRDPLDLVSSSDHSVTNSQHDGSSTRVKNKVTHTVVDRPGSTS